MADSIQSRVWTELARELIERRDVRPEVKATLEAALERDDAEATAKAVRQAMARAITGEEQRRRDTERTTVLESEARRERARARARQVRGLVEHGLSQLQGSDERAPMRVFTFLRDQLLTYARIALEAADESLEAPQSLAERVLEAVSERRVMARPMRVGILTTNEVAALATGSLKPDQVGTVRSTGDLDRDLASWRSSSHVDEARKEALGAGELTDGEYLFAMIEPSAGGHRVVVHPITAEGDTTPEPLDEIGIPDFEEPVSALELMVEPAVREPTAPTQLEAPRLRTAAVEPTANDLPGLRNLAVSVNQARLNLYTSILDSRADLADEARSEVERRLARIQEESETVAGVQEPERISAFVAKWKDELTTDMERLVAVSGTGSLGALSRLGALRHRLDSVDDAVRGIERPQRNLRGAGSESLMLARPQAEPTSIFDGLSGQTLAPSARRAVSQPVAGESLTADVVARDAERSARPTSETRQVLSAIKSSGEHLRRALTTMDTLHDSGLGLSSQLRPLLRAAMPSDVRPDLSSPLMRNVLMPALEQVSGRGAARARVAQRSAGSPQMTPEALYGLLLGQTGMDLVEAQPEMARNVLNQLAGLADTLSAAGMAGNVAGIMKAGQGIVDKVKSMAQTGEEPGTHDAQEGAKQAVGSVAAEAGLGGGGGEAASNLIDDAAGALAGEGAELKSALKDKISQFLPDNVPYGQKLFQGKLTDLVLSQMGAAGATVGDDVYMRSDLSAQDQTAVAAHELTHVTQRQGRSVEDMEQEAYAVESKVRDFLSGVELAAERPAGGAGGGADAPAEREEEAMSEMVLEELADIISRWVREAAEQSAIMNSGSAL